VKLRVTLKDSDVLYDEIQRAVALEVEALSDLGDEEKAALKESREGATRKLCSHWFEYSEYLTVEIDTTSRTCVVVPAREK
jgi:hypothetical protein